MRKILCASVLVLALCGSAFAGDMGCPPIALGDIPNPPSASQSSDVPTIDGSTGTEASALAADIAHGDDAGGFAAIALSVINSVLALV